MRRYTHILFDHDGVLVDTEPLYYRATREALRELGVELSLARYFGLMADGVRAWELAKGATGEEIGRARWKRNLLYRSLLAAESIEIEGVEEVLGRLRSRYALAIVTTSLPEDFALIHRGRRILPLVDFVLTRSAYRRSKPHPDPYLTALARFGIGPERALAVEDSERGLKAAVAAGIDCAVVHNDFTEGQDFSLAKYRVGDLSELATRVLA